MWLANAQYSHRLILSDQLVAIQSGRHLPLQSYHPNVWFWAYGLRLGQTNSDTAYNSGSELLQLTLSLTVVHLHHVDRATEGLLYRLSLILA